jgi:hypothetical protein
MARRAIDRAGSFSLDAGQLAGARCEVIWEPVTTVCSWPDDCLWGLAPQSSLSPICAAYPSSAFSEHWEPRLPAKSSRLVSPLKLPASGHSGPKPIRIFLAKCSQENLRARQRSAMPRPQRRDAVFFRLERQRGSSRMARQPSEGSAQGDRRGRCCLRSIQVADRQTARRFVCGNRGRLTRHCDERRGRLEPWIAIPIMGRRGQVMR